MAGKRCSVKPIMEIRGTAEGAEKDGGEGNGNDTTILTPRRKERQQEELGVEATRQQRLHEKTWLSCR
jgi:hypothetical protein